MPVELVPSASEDLRDVSHPRDRLQDARRAGHVLPHHQLCRRLVRTRDWTGVDPPHIAIQDGTAIVIAREIARVAKDEARTARMAYRRERQIRQALEAHFSLHQIQQARRGTDTPTTPICGSRVDSASILQQHSNSDQTPPMVDCLLCSSCAPKQVEESQAPLLSFTLYSCAHTRASLQKTSLSGYKSLYGSEGKILRRDESVAASEGDECCILSPDQQS